MVDHLARPKNPGDATFFADVVSNVGTGVAAYDRTGKIRYANEHYAEMLGTESADLESRHITVTNPEFDRKKFADYWASFGTGETRQVETVLRRFGDDSIVPVLVTTTHTAIGEEQFHIGTVQEITERKHYEEQLETQRDLLGILNQMVRHDLRNDLQIVEAYARKIEDHIEDIDEQAEEYLTTIQQCATDATEFTKTAGDLAEVIRQPDADLYCVSLTETIRNEVKELQKLYTDARVDIRGSLPTVEVLATDMLGSVIRNLIQNGIEHNYSETPEVHIGVDRIDESVEVRVVDNGPGIPDRHKDQIFKEGKTGIESDGTGIGLYLAQTLVERYDGDIRVEDADPDGSLFTIQLPIAE
jgi:PAS domain S-box-containing protein